MIRKIIVPLLILFQAQVYSNDVLLTADEVSNSISIIDENTFKLLEIIPLGPDREYALSSSIKPGMQTNVHGLSLSPDKKTLVVTSNISNSVVLYDVGLMAKPIKYFNVGLSPHVSMYTPDGKEIWVASRGTSSVDIIDVKKLQLIKKLEVSNCPSFFGFMTKKPIVFIVNTCTTNLDVVNYKTKKIIKRIPLNGIFSPLIALTPDQKEAWVIRKDAEEVLRIDTEKMEQLESIKVGSYPQHIAFTTKNNLPIGIVTVGGENKVKFYSYTPTSKNSSLLVGEVNTPGVPHGMVMSPDGRKVYVATEFGDEVASISIDKLVVNGIVKVGNSPQSLIFAKELNYVKSNELVPRNDPANIETIKIDLESNNPKIKGASLSIRSAPHNIYTTFVVFGNFEFKDEFNFYLSKSVKSVGDINTDDKTLIGYVFCRAGGFSCIDYSSMTQDFSTIEKIKNKKYKIFAVNRSKTIFLQSK